MLSTFWDNLWNSSENILHHKLKNNPYYPFTIRQPHVYELNYMNHNLAIGIFLGSIQLSGIFIFIFLLGAWLIVTSVGRRSLIIDLIEDMYEFYIYRYLMHKGPLGEIYIRLKSQKTGQGVLYYRLILNGPHIEVLNLTGIRLTINSEKLEKMGLRLAAKLNLNYFDFTDISLRHVIRHWVVMKV
ncbi:cation channel sperm-associated auxiliary subunit TMEM249-like isoform X2 [Leucoraja erinacea]|uniref:cation channel sperm-associated auxiliary subunit TMEM249-like isoform X2 n=1 Tax=Leucoraja erinaceus TaxID=7782 RepID=UPI002454229C|nr:cation channel sperm-associated auxiliary subunit TMEM249-like isoform X2 [Leucoraja erinacea]